MARTGAGVRLAPAEPARPEQPVHVHRVVGMVMGHNYRVDPVSRRGVQQREQPRGSVPYPRSSTMRKSRCSRTNPLHARPASGHPQQLPRTTNRLITGPVSQGQASPPIGTHAGGRENGYPKGSSRSQKVMREAARVSRGLPSGTASFWRIGGVTSGTGRRSVARRCESPTRASTGVAAWLLLGGVRPPLEGLTA